MATIELTLIESLGDILDIAGEMFTLIRTRSAYTPGGDRDEDAIAVMWLSDCGHNLNIVGAHIRDGRFDAAADALGAVRAAFEQHVGHPQWMQQHGDTLKHFKLKSSQDPGGRFFIDPRNVIERIDRLGNALKGFSLKTEPA